MAKRIAKEPAPTTLHRRPEVEFWAPGIPRPKGSTRGWAVKKGGAFTGQVAMGQANPKTRSWEGVVAACASANGVLPLPFPRPVTVVLRFYFPRPGNHYGSGKNAGVLKANAPVYPVQWRKNDVDKLVRGVLDAIDGVAYEDDAQVVTVLAHRRWADPVKGPGARIRIIDMEGQERKA